MSMVIFLPMGLGMFLVFFPQMAKAWLFLPVAGQQLLMELILKGGQLPLVAFTSVTLTTLATAAALLRTAARLLHRDDVVYGD